jgi:catechol 2,3-dioxygenase-like lactoylglutathione lyase family enzyme
MVRTYGLTHINLVVRDAERSLRFYGQVFGVEEYGRADGLVHTKTPGCQDVITFDERSSGAGESRGIAHFGFALFQPGTSTRLLTKSSTPAASCFGGANSVLAAPTPTSLTRMATKSKFGMSEPAALGFRTHSGWTVVVAATSTLHTCGETFPRPSHVGLMRAAFAASPPWSEVL